MEHFEYSHKVRDGRGRYCRQSAIAGVVASGNLEVLMEVVPLDGGCEFIIDTAAEGFTGSWQAVIADFMARNCPADLRVSINDNAASPSVVALRLDQTLEALTGEADK